MQAESNENMLNRTCIIVPCYNESASIKAVIDELAETAAEAEIVVINDGSSDSTFETAKMSGKATVIDLPINLGVGGAVQTGLKYAFKSSKDFAIKVDGDGQHDPAHIATLLQPLITDQADIVVGSRFLQENSGFKSTIWRRVGIRFFQFLCQSLTGQRITDPTSGFRAYNRHAIKFMANNYPSFDYPEPEEVILACKNNLRIVEVPVKMRNRQAGTSTISSSISVYYMLKVTLAMLFIYLRKPEKKE
ncbi:MAG: glycosyl transferase [uncultured bacterium]|nr:MAG: glycosyl transferase [uncultured bacterium]